MLLIFAFSITPKKYLHDLVADHTDFYGYSSQHEKAINKIGLDCDKDDLVVSVPFIESITAFSFECISNSTGTFFTAYKYLPSKLSATNDVRGPPAMII